MYVMSARIPLPLISRKKLPSGLKMISWHPSALSRGRNARKAPSSAKNRTPVSFSLTRPESSAPTALQKRTGPSISGGTSFTTASTLSSPMKRRPSFSENRSPSGPAAFIPSCSTRARFARIFSPSLFLNFLFSVSQVISAIKRNGSVSMNRTMWESPISDSAYRTIWQG
ncbi:hypothetical protein SDC9_152169 [bioreactor metagenome]|uniref:Uncharacterized protein n=1 Tax=bioreactor metagenome TaxID=1076179 RepID=A0A645ESB9_9ZZZZ